MKPFYRVDFEYCPRHSSTKRQRRFKFYIREFCSYTVVLSFFLFPSFLSVLLSFSASVAAEISVITDSVFTLVSSAINPDHINPTICPTRPWYFDRDRFRSERALPPSPRPLPSRGNHGLCIIMLDISTDVACPSIFVIRSTRLERFRKSS